jgi:hypothetical protein
MKTQHLPLLLLGCFILSSLFTLSNCKDDCAEKKILLKDLERYVPYTGNDTLRFLHNSSDTQIFVGQGLERFYVKHKKQEDYACPEEHESVRIRFKNIQTNDEIKMEYVFDLTEFSVSSSADNSYTNYKFYSNNAYYGSVLTKDDLKYSTVKSNDKVFNYIRFFYYPNNKTYFFAYRPPVDGNYSGIVKIKRQSDTLEIIQ